MSVTQHAQSTANRAADSKTLEYLTRGGFIGYGIVHLLFAWLALQIAFGHAKGDSDQSGALRELASHSFGKTLVVLTIVGLVAMAVWQAFEAAIGHRSDEGKTRIAERVASAGRVLVYLYIAYTGYKVIKGANSSNADSQQKTSENLMSATGGRWLVGLIGLVVAGIGIGLVVYGVLKKFEKHLHTERMSSKTRTLSRRLGVAGYSAKGVAYTLVGGLLVAAAVTYDPKKARGLDGALRTLAEQSYGTWLLTLVAAGIAAFGVFCLIQARYRKV
jgi:hypothetical protein